MTDKKKMEACINDIIARCQADELSTQEAVTVCYTAMRAFVTQPAIRAVFCAQGIDVEQMAETMRVAQLFVALEASARSGSDDDADAGTDAAGQL